MVKPLASEQTGDRQLNQIQDNIKSATNTLRSSPFGDGNLVKSIAMVPGTVTVNHGLGRAIQGFIVVRYQVTAGTIPSAIVEVSNPSTLGITIDTTKQVVLGATNIGVADVWFW